VKHKDLGFDTEKLLHLNVGDLSEGELATLMKKFGQYHGVKALSATSGIPGANGLNNWNGYNIIHVDTSAAKTFGFKIVQGRGLLPGDANKACLINVAALSKLDGGTFQGKKACDLEIVGVVADFHYSSLYQQVGPVALLYSDYWRGQLTARISGPVGEAVVFFGKAWMETCPDKLFDLQFYDQAFAAMYRKEENLATLVGIFTVLAVVISALGIFGLAVFQSQQRIKEIGIRKVLGATAVEITAMLTKNFTKWAIAADVLAWPVAYYFADKWLQNFAYRIEIQWWMFALSGSIALVIALLTVSTQAIKAAMANPVDSLRYE
jgi:putative ABC transport system permease protein